ncbi:QWRF motif-containing protein 7 [Linum perenne]
MDHYPSSSDRRHRRHLPATLPSPKLVRSRSTTETNPAITSPSTTSLSRSQRHDTVSRSKSTTKSRYPKTVSVIEPDQYSTRKQSDGLIRFLPRGESHVERPRRSKPTPRPNYNKQSRPLSPSAWALSPGRPTTNYLPIPPSPPPAAAAKPKRRSSGGGGIIGVWKYFKKGSSTTREDEDCRRKFRVMNGTLVQWRFANAKTEAAAAAVERVARAKLLHVWVRIAEKRKKVTEKRMEIQGMKAGEKLSRMMSWQLSQLTEWGKMEGKNVVAVSRVSRKLAAVSLKVPLSDDVKGEVESIEEALKSAMEVMDGIQEHLSKFFLQLETNLYLLTELTSSVEHQNDRLEETEKIVAVLAHLLVSPWAFLIFDPAHPIL